MKASFFPTFFCRLQYIDPLLTSVTDNVCHARALLRTRLKQPIELSCSCSFRYVQIFHEHLNGSSVCHTASKHASSWNIFYPFFNIQNCFFDIWCLFYSEKNKPELLFAQILFHSSHSEFDENEKRTRLIRLFIHQN